jgi:hypothetical protein
MIKLLLLAAALASCAPTAYYVANIYADDHGGLVTERCPIDNGRHGDKPDPDHCRYERVGPVPAEVQASLGGPPPGPPPAPPAAPPAPPAP